MANYLIQHDTQSRVEFIDGAQGDLKGWMVSAKLSPPQQNVRLVSRKRLLIDEDSHHFPLWLISAPAGFGKTTLLSQWREHSLAAGTRVGWLSLDEEDGNPAHFVSYLIFAIAAAEISTGRLEMLAEQGLSDTPPRTALAALLKSIADHGGRVALVLDDYHRVDARGIDELVHYMAVNSPPNFSLIIASRHAPSINVPQLVASGVAIETHPEDLRFLESETREALDREISADALAKIMDRTEGWPVAVQLAGILLHDDTSFAVLDRFTGNVGYIASYLIEEVFVKLPNELQQFLIQTSILDRFNADLANSVCGSKDSWHLIKRLAPLRSLIIPFDDKGEWYRYHHLFGECLHDLLRQTLPERQVQLHRSAAIWFSENGFTLDAVKHASTAGDYDFCSDIVCKAGGWELVLYGGTAFLSNLLRFFPPSRIADYPRVQIALAYVRLKQGALAESRALLDAAASHPLASSAENRELSRDLTTVNRIIDSYEDRITAPGDLERLERELSELPLNDAICRACAQSRVALTAIAAGRFDLADIAIPGAMRSMRQASSMLGLNYMYLQAGIAALYQAKGRLAEANFREALRMAEDNFGADSGLKFIADLMLTSLLYWRNELSDNEWSTFLIALDRVEHSDGWFEIFANAYELAVDKSIADGDISAAEGFAKRAAKVAASRGLNRLGMLADAMQLEVEIHQSESKPSVAFRISESVGSADWGGEQPLWRPLIAQSIALASHLQRPSAPRAIVTLSAPIKYCERIGANLALIRLLVRRAIAFDVHGHRDKALDDLTRAATLAAPEAFSRPFCDSALSPALLRAAHQAGRAAALDTFSINFLEERVAARNSATSQAATEAGLSLREIELLRELSNGMSNKEIARVLDITEHTVKFHMKNIFRKLGVDRRSRAVILARSWYHAKSLERT